MPEGPEIRRAADNIERVLAGRRIEEVFFWRPELQAFQGRLRGDRVLSVVTRGKAMLTQFENGLTLYSHNQLYGRWFTVRRGQEPRTNRSLRVALHTQEHSALLYSASDVAVLTASELSTHPFLSRLGPDILDRELTAGDIAMRLADARFRRRGLAALYLDQGFLAGVGNYLRSEILHFAGLHPALRPMDLGEESLGRLGRETLAVGRRAYTNRGVTLGRQERDRLRDSPYGARERFRVFGRAGKACFSCGASVQRRDFTGRRLYFCPGCQPQRAAR